MSVYVRVSADLEFADDDLDWTDGEGNPDCAAISQRVDSALTMGGFVVAGLTEVEPL